MKVLFYLITIILISCLNVAALYAQENDEEPTEPTLKERIEMVLDSLKELKTSVEAAESMTEVEKIDADGRPTLKLPDETTFYFGAPGTKPEYDYGYAIQPFTRTKLAFVDGLLKASILSRDTLQALMMHFTFLELFLLDWSVHYNNALVGDGGGRFIRISVTFNIDASSVLWIIDELHTQLSTILDELSQEASADQAAAQFRQKNLLDAAKELSSVSRELNQNQVPLISRWLAGEVFEQMISEKGIEGGPSVLQSFLSSTLSMQGFSEASVQAVRGADTTHLAVLLYAEGAHSIANINPYIETFLRQALREAK
jgi:hypothetical protein